MSMSMEEVGLAAYTNRLSGRPGDTIRFQVSSSSACAADGSNDGVVTAKLTRCICSDPNPSGPGCIEEDASEWFPPRQFEGRHQPIRNGSHARTRDPISVPETTHRASVEIWMFPTHVPKAKEGDGGHAAVQCVWDWGELGLYLKPDGRLAVRYGSGKWISSDAADDDDEQHPRVDSPLLPRKWYRVMAVIGKSNREGNDCYCELDVTRQEKASKEERRIMHAQITLRNAHGDLGPSMIPTDAHFELAAGGTFNGRLENPKIEIRDETTGLVASRPLISWDTSKNMTEWSVPSDDCVSAQRDNPLVLHNHPTRAARGRLWDGTEFAWKHEPSHYGGIHFHSDDIYDFDWDCDMEWTIPRGIPSGIYIMRLINEQCHEETLPLFICPPLVQRSSGDGGGNKKKICILISTFTYVMYGNHARADFQTNWLDRMRDWDAYPHNPCQYPAYGRSTYNFHEDESGICFASHLRPLFNLRPKYLTFGDSACSGLRHFPADTHLISWMHHHAIDYDIVTDHELHRDGVAAIAGYQTLMTGTHPEYHTLESLNALQDFRDGHGGNLIYLGGNGFYWRVAAKDEDASMLEIRRAEDGVRTWASEPGEYYHMLDGGNYGGLWRRNDRPPQQLVGVGFTAQGTFEGMPYERVCFDPEVGCLFEGIQSDALLGDFGYSGNGAAGFELDCVDRRLDGGEHTIFILAQSFDKGNNFMLVPEEVLTTYSNLSGSSSDEARRSDMVYFRTKSGARVFSVGSITFCGSLPWDRFNNNISILLQNVIRQFSSR